MSGKHSRQARAVGLCLLVFFIGFVRGGYSQTFSSGSNGSDGALSLTSPGTIIFDPKSFTPPLDPDGDNVYHFTTINIAAGVTVKLSSKNLSGPIYWLARDSVTIAGTIDLNGEVGHPGTTFSNLRVPAAGGAGGFNGGVGGTKGVAGAPLPQPGNGPGGGAVGQGTTNTGSNGMFTGSQYLIPLIGGSGGGGGASGTAGNFGSGGGGGGGAILIASSTSITIPDGGRIVANGGNNGNYPTGCNSTQICGGGGSGGAIRLIAPTVVAGGGGNRISVRGGVGSSSATPGGSGLVRVETFGSVNADAFDPSIIVSPPFSPAIPATPPSTIKVTSLVTATGNFPINANPFSFPDATISAAGPVTVNVQAQYIPTGTIPKIIVMSESGPDQTVDCSALNGTLQQSTCNAQITFPTGGSRGFVKATWQ